MSLSKSAMAFYTCEECGEQSSSEDIWIWCKPCNARHFQEQFNNWTSGNKVVDRFIQDTQINASVHFQKIEWIPYELFTNVEYLAQGGYGRVYKATWKNGYIYKWDVKKKDWSRRGKLLGEMKVVLKSLHNSKEIPADFFNEIKHQLQSIDVKGGYKIIPCYGITKDPKTNDYMMVMRYAEGGSLRKYLDKNFYSLDWYQKFKILHGVLKGLEQIHNAGLTHRDLHSGNIVLLDFEDTCITDFGLCKSINNDILEEKHTFGILPYIAPEVLCKHEYTQPADIYSFGIIMNEMATGFPPYYDVRHDVDLALKICRGSRPNVNANITPKLFIELTRRCWDAKPENRPTAQYLNYQFGKWFGIYDSEEYDQFWNQVREIEQRRVNQSRSASDDDNASRSELHYTSHNEAFLTSRAISLPDFPPINTSERVSDSGLVDLEIPDAI